MTGYRPGADANDELCPYLTDAEPVVPAVRAETAVPRPRAEVVVPGGRIEPGDELCPPLTEDAAVRDAARGTRHAEGARRGFPADGPVAATPWVRPYVLTGGRTRAYHELLVHTLVSAPDYSPSVAVQLPPEARLLYERAHAHTESVAELSAHCGIPLGVTRVLLSDLIAASLVLVGPEPYASPYDSDLLERIIDGLQQFV
jgi:Protein of unknown function (DUF742)